jgi:hypothetical protein
LRSDEHDVIKGRKAILGYVYTPGMLEALYRMYAPHFMLELENAARQPRKNVSLKDDQIADMMSIYAERFLRLSSALDAASSVDIKALAEAIHHASEKEYSANEDFSRAYSAYALSKDAGDQNEAAIQSRRMLESSRQAGMYAAAQDKVRQNLAYELRRKAVGQTLQNTELIFLGEWLARHEASAEASRMAADVCRRMAERCSQRARELKNGNAEPTEDLEGKLSASVPTAVPADAIQE